MDSRQDWYNGYNNYGESFRNYTNRNRYENTDSKFNIKYKLRNVTDMSKFERFYNKLLNKIFPNRRSRLISEIMKRDQELGLYDETFKQQEQ